MSVPAPHEPRSSGRWETIREAIQDNPKTFRLCLIIVATAVSVSPGLLAITVELVRHVHL